MLISSTEPFRYGLLYGFIVVPYTVNKVASRCRTATKSKNIKLDFLNCKIEPLVKSQEFRNLFSNKTYTFIRFINYTIKPPPCPHTYRAIAITFIGTDPLYIDCSLISCLSLNHLVICGVKCIKPVDVRIIPNI